MNRYHWIGIGLGGIVLAFLGAYAIFGLLLIGFDVASYSSDGVTVSELEYDDVLTRATKAGYSVDRVDSSGFHPDGIDELDRELGPEYEVFRIVLDYSETQRMWVSFYEDEGKTVVTMMTADVRGPLTVDHLPPDEWIIEQLMVVFGMDDDTASAYVSDLRSEIQTTDPSTPGAHTPSIDVTESISFGAVYADLSGRATVVNSSSTPGTGWHVREYYRDEGRLGEIDFVLARSTITHDVDGSIYRVHVDYHGGIRVDAQTRAYRSFEEDVVRHMYREIFEDLGIPPETIDHMHLTYRGSVW